MSSGTRCMGCWPVTIRSLRSIRPCRLPKLGIDPARMARAQGSRRELLKTFMQRDADGSLRWNVAMYPTDAYAQDAEMSVDDLADFVLGACLVDEDDPVAAWEAVAARQQALIDRLAGKREIR